MKKFTLLVLGGLFFGLSSVYGEEQTDYTVDFNDSISTSDKEFKVAPGWAHLAESSVFGSYVSYSYTATDGVDGSGALKVGTNLFSDGYGDYETVTDLLITPAVTGTAKIKVEKVSRSGDIAFYYVNYANGKYSKGDAIDVTVPELSTDSFTEVSIPNISGQRIGIAANNVMIDDFSADKADVVLTKSLKLVSVSGVENYSSVDADENNKFNLIFTAEVQNNGDIDIAADDENATLSLMSYADSSVLSTTAIGQALAVGASAQVTVSGDIDATKYQGRNRFDVKENISGSQELGAWVTVVPYQGIFSLSDASNSTVYADTSATTKTIDFGIITADATKTLTISNSGAKELNITELSVTDGFSLDTTAPLTIAKHGTATIKLTMAAGEPGIKEGTLTVKGDDLDKAIAISGQVLDSTAWYVNFEDNHIPNNMYTDGSWATTNIEDWNLANNKYAVWESESSENSKLVSPKLEVAEGDKLTFMADRCGTGSYINVYYSADRTNWTKVRTLSANTTVEDDLLPADYSGYDWGYNVAYNFKTFTIDNIPAGQWYVAFEAGYARIDDILGYKVVPVDHDIIITHVDAPETGTVNHDAAIAVTAKNATNNVETAGSYTAKLYVDGEAVASAETPELAAGATNTYDFVFTPRKSGVNKVVVVLGGDNFSATDTITMNVAEEQATKKVQVLNPTSMVYGTLINSWDYYSESENDYSAAELGIPAGSKIHKITFKGYSSGTFDAKARIYIDNTTGDIAHQEPLTPADTTAMTKIFDGTLSFSSAAGDASNPYDMVSVTLDTPFEYTGGNLRIATASNSNFYMRLYYQVDPDSSVQGQSIYRSADNNISTATWKVADAPVMYLELVSQPKVVAGKVTDSEGNAVAGAKVKFTSGNVIYVDTTDAKGNYSVAIVQDDKAYNLFVSATGYTPYQCANFTTDKDTTVNVTLAAAKGFFVNSYDIPTTGTVNNEYKASVNVLNTLATDIKAADYTAKLYVEGKVVATAETMDVKGGESTTLKFSYYSHEAVDSAKVCIVIATADDAVSTDTVNVRFMAERALKEVIIGTPGTTIRPGYSTKVAPINTYDKISESEIVYKKSDIGLAANSVITSIAFKGYHSNKVTAPVRVYIENTTDELSGAITTVHDTTTMTKVLDGTFVFEAEGSSADNLMDELVINLGEGFTYTGDNLRIITAFGEADGWANIAFESDESNTECSYVRSDDSDISSEEFSATALPVAHLTVIASRNVSGTVTSKDDSTPVEGATVTLKSGNVEYYGSTDTEGNYSITVSQADLSYDAFVTADGFTSDTVAVTFENGDTTVDFALAKTVEPFAVVATEPADSSFYTSSWPNLEAWVTFSEDVTVKNVNPAVTFVTTDGTALEPDDTWKAVIDDGRLHVFGLDYDGFVQSFSVDETKTYVITIPAGVVKTADGVENDEIVIIVFGSEEAKNTADGINVLNTDKTDKKIVGIYSMNGAKQTSLSRGVNIVKYADGSSKKIIVK